MHCFEFRAKNWRFVPPEGGGVIVVTREVQFGPRSETDSCAIQRAIASYLERKLEPAELARGKIWLVEPHGNHSWLTSANCRDGGVELRSTPSSPDGGFDPAFVFWRNEVAGGVHFGMVPADTRPNANWLGVLADARLTWGEDAGWRVEPMPLGKSLRGTHSDGGSAGVPCVLRDAG